jgi:hypothetical protein
MELETISEYRLEEYPYFLTVEEEEGVTVKLLFHEGKEIKRWRIEREGKQKRSERYFEDGELKRETLYKTGQILTERHYERNGTQEVHRYKYVGNELRAIEVYNAENRLLYSLEYLRAKDGRLRKVEKIIPESGNVTSAYVFGENSLSKEWHEQAGEGELFLFNQSGDVIAQERWRGQELLYVEEYGVSRENISIQKDIKTGITREKTYDDQGRVVYEKAQKDGNLIETIQYQYSQDQLVYKRVHTPGLVEEWRYYYDSSGDLQREEYSKNNTLRTITTYTDENAYVIEYVREDEVFLRVFFEDEVKIKEEFVGSRNG